MKWREETKRPYVRLGRRQTGHEERKETDRQIGCEGRKETDRQDMRRGKRQTGR